MSRKIKSPISVPHTLQWIGRLWLTYFVLYSVCRLVTIWLFIPANQTWYSLIPAIRLGMGYDAKWIGIVLLPIALLSVIRRLNPFYSLANKRWWIAYLTLVTLLIFVFYGADFGNFSYNHTRINASALNFAEDPAISFRMLWQSYPMVWMLLGLCMAVVILAKVFTSSYNMLADKRAGKPSGLKYQTSAIWYGVAILFLCWSIFGLFSFRQLKWENAFRFNDNFKSYVALNPMQNFFTTLSLRKPSFDSNKVIAYKQVMNDFLSVEVAQANVTNYKRVVGPAKNAIASSPNIVIVICESFSMYKSSMSGNLLNSTPYFKSMCDNGIFFDHCFSATFGTARGVFAVLTGTPDVQLSKFSTQSPEAIQQHTIINDLRDYDKFYFLGGSTDFNNFDGLIRNIKDVKIYQEGSYSSKTFNVWGISDKKLFLHADTVLSKQKKPFIAIIQTADNHRPFSIPAEDIDFIKRFVSSDTLAKYGFETLKEFQAFCYTDYCYRNFIEEAKKHSYFNNTIFAFVGDHGLEGEAGSVYPKAWTDNRLSDEHVPLLFYAPGLLTAKLHTETVSQVDILPTLAGMLPVSYVNTTIGRDLLKEDNKYHAAFIIHHDEGNIGIVNDDYYYLKNLRINKEQLVPIRSDKMFLSMEQQDSVKKKLSLLCSAIYETARWMLLHNKENDF